MCDDQCNPSVGDNRYDEVMSRVNAFFGSLSASNLAESLAADIRAMIELLDHAEPTLAASRVPLASLLSTLERLVDYGSKQDIHQIETELFDLIFSDSRLRAVHNVATTTPLLKSLADHAENLRALAANRDLTADEHENLRVIEAFFNEQGRMTQEDLETFDQS